MIVSRVEATHQPVAVRQPLTTRNGLLGRRIQRAERSRFWSAVLRPALRAPLETFVISVGVLGVVALPAADLHLKRPTATDLPRSIAALHNYDRLAAAFPGNELGTSHTRRDPDRGRTGPGRQAADRRAG